MQVGIKSESVNIPGFFVHPTSAGTEHEVDIGDHESVRVERSSPKFKLVRPVVDKAVAKCRKKPFLSLL